MSADPVEDIAAAIGCGCFVVLALVCAVLFGLAVAVGQHIVGLLL